MSRFLIIALAVLAFGPLAAQNLIILDLDAESEAPISFEAPIVSEDPAIDGQSLAGLVQSRPMFPPIEGLPESVWAEKTCAGCHQWDQATLCTQAQFYLSEAGQVGLTKTHPYGGGFKQTLRKWGSQGCQ